MKKLLTLALAAGLAAIATAENFRIDISGQSNQVGLVVKQMDDGITGTQAEWLGDKKDQRLIFCGPLAGKWEKKSFSFLAKKDGKISICLMGDENRADAPLIAYDDIKVNGQPLINGGFEASSEKIAPWSSWGKAKLATDGGAAEGNNFVLANHHNPAIQDFSVKGGELVTVTVQTKAAN